MKRKQFIFIIVIAAIALLSVLSIFYVKRKAEVYRRSIAHLDIISGTGLYRLIEDYQHDYGEYPANREAILSFFDHEPYAIEYYDMNDPLSKSGEILQYYPLYDKQTREMESFIFLSSGIDGRFDNKFSPSDTLFIDTWHEKLKAYNSEYAITKGEYNRLSKENMEIMPAEELINILPEYPELDFNFNFWDYLFGRKDYIVQIGEMAMFPIDYTDSIN